ncbi:MAG: hypothetical protein PHV16_02080 [Candidatus Nanoarchaeia archaeon]|nr:hypothetical protein [Candidatus Nanoarchaeia archaeon]
MAILAAKWRVKYKGIFDIKALYEYLYHWSQEDGWFNGKDTDFNEVFHGQHEYPGGSKELWIWWRLDKVPNDSSYFKYELDLDWHAVPPFKDVEIVHNGKKLKLASCDLEMQLHARVVTDYNGTWGKHWLLKHFEAFYWKVLMKQQFEKQKLELYREAYRLQDIIKDYWRLYKGVEEDQAEAGFWPPGTIGE